MSKTIIVGGFGPGISTAVAERFGGEGFAVALVGRNAERLNAGVKALEAKKIKAQAFVADLGDPEQVRTLVGKVRDALGPIDVLHWNAYNGAAGDVTTASTAEVRSAYDIAVTGLVAGIQAALPDLRAQKGSVLVTNGGLGQFDPGADEMGVSWSAMGLSIANAAKHKLLRLLAIKLKSDGVYVGEVIVHSLVKGSAFDNGNATLDPKLIGAKFWELQQARAANSVSIS